MLAERFIKWLDDRGSSRMITRRFKSTGEVGPYLKRFFIFSTTYVTIFLHQFWSSDPDDVHCHPWSNLKIRIKGTYREYGMDGKYRTLRPGSITYRRAEDFHRIMVEEGQEGKGWSVFIHFKRRRTWGFIFNGKWMEAGEYGRYMNNPVEINGVDYVIEGTFFPKIRWLNKGE